MDRPHAIIVAGPNGSGKTTLANEYLAAHPLPYISADLIADSLAAPDLADIRLQAGRLFFERIEAQIATGQSFLTEATLSGQTFRRVIDGLHDRQYGISIAFVFLLRSACPGARPKGRPLHPKGRHHPAFLSELQQLLASLPTHGGPLASLL
jgi:predicted ABC-type ATPase